ncbi:unnamed protein product [Trichogramma brassicae]|uniref:Reverse transcriptase domain-containing protein n=1 Tax=Trichogramma brassicae TaxID=86971 RepID=A0A6H5ICV4_9HYME|nr:unnamed protein product [Trichogramma brassicae]
MPAMCDHAAEGSEKGDTTIDDGIVQDRRPEELKKSEKFKMSGKLSERAMLLALRRRVPTPLPPPSVRMLDMQHPTPAQAKQSSSQEAVRLPKCKFRCKSMRKVWNKVPHNHPLYSGTDPSTSAHVGALPPLRRAPKRRREYVVKIFRPSTDEKFYFVTRAKPLLEAASGRRMISDLCYSRGPGREHVVWVLVTLGKSAALLRKVQEMCSAQELTSDSAQQPGAPSYIARRGRRATAAAAAVVGSRCLSRGREVAPIPVRPRNGAIRRARRDLHIAFQSLLHLEHLLELSRYTNVYPRYQNQDRPRAPARSSLHPDFNQPRSIAGSQRLQAAIGRKQYDADLFSAQCPLFLCHSLCASASVPRHLQHLNNLDDAITRHAAQAAVEKADRLHQRLKSLSYPHISDIHSPANLDAEQMDQLTDRIIAAIAAKSKPRQSRSPEQSSSHQRSRSQPRTNFGPNKDLCYYHFKYKLKAKKVFDLPCAWRKYEREWAAEEKDKKSPRLDMCEASIPGALGTKRLFIKDLSLHLVFLIDTGAEVSVLPKDGNCTSPSPPLILHAANGSIIHTYGTRLIDINFGFRRVTRWSFISADVPYPIIGADALAHFGWLPDLQAKKLIDKTSGISAQGHLASAPVTGISLIDPQHPFAQVLSQYTALFKSQQGSGARATGVFHHLLTSGEPIAQRPRRLLPEKLKAAKKQFAIWCEDGTCRPSDSPWASPIHIVPKKNPGEFRVCGDFRKLNAVTQPNRYPVPNLHDFTSILNDTCIYSTLDLYQAFNQIPMAPEDIEKTAVISPVGLFEFLFMPFGLRNASQTFQRYVNQALGDLDFVFIYIDDVLIASNTREQHETHLKVVLDRLLQHNLRLNLAKCVFGQEKVVFLSHVVNAKGFSPLPDKLKDVQNFPQPCNIDELRRFLGLINFYRAFIPRAAEILAPLNKLIVGAKKKDTTPILWSAEADKAFLDSKQALANATALGFS